MLDAAAAAAMFSDDPSTQNGAYIGDSLGYNHVPGRVVEALGRDVVYGDRALKNSVTVHAEVSAVLNSREAGDRWVETDAHVVWASCPHCAAVLVEHGITRLVTCLRTYQATPERWREAVDRGLTILRDAGVKVEWFTEPLGVTIRFDGKELEL